VLACAAVSVDPATPLTGPLVAARGLGLRYPGPAGTSGVLALTDVDLEIGRGEFVALVGPSGCGKSTLLRAIAGLTEISSGELRVADITPRLARTRWGRAAFVFQDPTLLPWRTVRDNVALPLELGRSAGEVHREAVDRALALVGLTEFADTHPAELSGGMRMRASLARALVTRPALLLLDEPFGALDELTREHLDDELLRLWQRDGFAALAVTHSLGEAVLLADRVLVMSPRPGRITHILTVTLPRPRPPELQTGREFTALLAELRARVQEAA
jgi:NitT/TauT family transport system ATP-binding protein